MIRQQLGQLGKALARKNHAAFQMTSGDRALDDRQAMAVGRDHPQNPRSLGALDVDAG